ncbi:MAG: GNAT family protein [Patescibacteria group bacterium]|nr:GNAT family protein [Patescibacteria group bacterium]
MSKKIILKGKKVILRPLSLTDAPRFCQWLKDREVTKFLSIHDQPPPSLQEERDWIRRTKTHKQNVVLAIDTIDGQHIGAISLRFSLGEDKVANYGISIGDQRYWGQGYGTEAGELMIEYGFKKLRLHRIHLECIAYNIRGIKSYQKLGFKIEGRLRDQIWRDGYWHDQIHMGILEQEYFNKSKSKKKE